MNNMNQLVEDRRSKNSQNRKLNGRQGGESQTAKVDREIAEKMLNGKGNGSSVVESQLQSQVQSKPGDNVCTSTSSTIQSNWLPTNWTS